MAGPITLIMPIKGPHPAYVGAAIRSVLEQSYASWQMIAICNAHEDAHKDLAVAKAEGDDSRIRWVCAPGIGPYGSINMGMRLAETPFVAQIHADDMLAPNAVETMCLYIEKFKDVGFFHSSRAIVDDDGRHIKTCWSKSADKRSDFLDGHVKHMLCWNRQMALAVGGVEENCMHGADDFDLPWSMFEAGCKFKAVMECLYLYRDHRSHYRLTTHVPLDKQEADLRMFFKKHRMNDAEIEAEMGKRKAGYLRQALFLNEQDMRNKQGIISAGSGWRET